MTASAHVADVTRAGPMLCAEIPSDSDSSRRPSAASQAPSDYSVPGAGAGSYDGAGAAVSPGSELSFRAGLGGGGGSRRRASHSGELAAAVTLLGVPSSRQRGDSLPGNSGQFATLLPQYSVICLQVILTTSSCTR